MHVDNSNQGLVRVPSHGNFSQKGDYKNLERGFFPGCRTDRFDWQQQSKAYEGFDSSDQGRRKNLSRQKSTEGKWQNLLEKTEENNTSNIKKRKSFGQTPSSKSPASNRNTDSNTHRVMKPDLLDTPKFEGRKVFAAEGIVNDTWQKRRVEQHERMIEHKFAKNSESYSPFAGIIPNTEGREQREFSRLGRSQFSQRDHSSRSFLDGNSALDSSRSHSRSITPSRLNKSNLQHGLIPTDERIEQSKIKRNPSLNQQGQAVKILLTTADNGGVIDPNIQSNISDNKGISFCSSSSSSQLSVSQQQQQQQQSLLNQKPKPVAKFVHEAQKAKAIGENAAFWNDGKCEQEWKNEIRLREEKKYGKNCDKEYILQENIMFQQQIQQHNKSTNSKPIPTKRINRSSSYTDFIGESATNKSDLKGISIPKKQSTNQKHQESDQEQKQLKKSNDTISISSFLRMGNPQQSNMQNAAYPQEQQQKHQRSLYEPSQSSRVQYIESSTTPSRSSVSKTPRSPLHQMTSVHSSCYEEKLRNKQKENREISPNCNASRISNHSKEGGAAAAHNEGNSVSHAQSYMRDVVQNLMKERNNSNSRGKSPQQNSFSDSFSILSCSVSQIRNNNNNNRVVVPKQISNFTKPPMSAVTNQTHRHSSIVGETATITTSTGNSAFANKENLSGSSNQLRNTHSSINLLTAVTTTAAGVAAAASHGDLGSKKSTKFSAAGQNSSVSSLSGILKHF